MILGQMHEGLCVSSQLQSRVIANIPPLPHEIFGMPQGMWRHCYYLLCNFLCLTSSSLHVSEWLETLGRIAFAENALFQILDIHLRQLGGAILRLFWNLSGRRYIDTRLLGFADLSRLGRIL